MKAFVYWNLHRGLWSVKALEGPNKGRVIARVPEVYLLDAVPKVSEAGRQRVLREKRKNVHAGVVGRIVEYSQLTGGRPVSYNPYKGPSFVYRDDGAEWKGAEVALLDSDRSVVVGRKNERQSSSETR